MCISELEKDNVKLTVIDDFDIDEDFYCEIVVNRNFLNTMFLYLLIMKNSIAPLSVSLTQKEEMILLYTAQGKDNKTIADLMNISIHTVKVHLRKIFIKLDAQDRTDAVVKAVKQGLINIY